MSGCWEAFCVTGFIQPGEVGRARVKVQEVNGAGALRAMLKGESLRLGERVAMLYVGGRLVMSDTTDELRDHRQLLREARGRVLLNGLGLGCALKAVLAKPEVEHADVVEIEPDVIALIAPYFDGERVTFHLGDAFEMRWFPGTRWNAAWHDVWSDKCLDDLPKHTRLLRKYGRLVDWQGCWAHDELLAHRRRERREARR